MSALGELRDLRDEVAEKITVKDLLTAYQVPYRTGGGRNELQAKACPRRRSTRRISPTAARGSG